VFLSVHLGQLKVHFKNQESHKHLFCEMMKQKNQNKTTEAHKGI